MNRLDFNDPALMDFLGIQQSQYLVQPEDILHKAIDLIHNGIENHGDPLPWYKTENCFRLRPAEVTVWAGVNGHGKSLLQGQVMLWLLPHTRIMIASMEMKPEATMARMFKQAAGNSIPTGEYCKGIASGIGQNLWIYDQLDTVDQQYIIAAVHHAAVALKCKHIVIDSLMKCGIGTDDYNGQKAFIDRLCWAAKTYDIHIHLIHHMRKGKHEDEIPDKFDVKGAGEIIDQVDNLVIVHRNKGKERKMAAGEDYDITERDCTLRIAKQRHHSWEGEFQLWFDEKSQQYTPKPESGPMPFPSPEMWSQPQDTWRTNIDD